MNQNKNEMPPGWSGESFQNNPWDNTPQHTQSPFSNAADTDAPLQTSGSSDKQSVSEDDFFGKIKQGASEMRSSADHINRAAQDRTEAQQTEDHSAPEPLRLKPQQLQEERKVYSEPPAFQNTPYPNESTGTEIKDMFSPLIILIPLITVILAFLGGLFFMRAKQRKAFPAETTLQAETTAVQDQIAITSETVTNIPDQTEAATAETTVTSETSASAKVSTATEAVSEQPAEPKTSEIPQAENVQEPVPEAQSPAAPAFDLKAEYRSIVNRVGAEMNTGYYADVNSDGQNELILKNPADMNYHMYTYDGEMHETYFGTYTSMNEAKLFRVPASNGQYYFYWRCEYQMRSIQGYYDPLNNSEIDIGINYNFEDHAEWKLWFNNNEYASGREEGASTYGATPNCYQKLLTMFQDYGYQIYDSSDYKKLDCLDKSALLRAIG